MARLPRFPSAPGFAKTKFLHGTYFRMINIFAGVSDYVDTAAHRKALKSNGCTLSCGFGLHSKAFVTMLLHLGNSLITYF